MDRRECGLARLVCTNDYTLVSGGGGQGGLGKLSWWKVVTRIHPFTCALNISLQDRASWSNLTKNSKLNSMKASSSLEECLSVHYPTQVIKYDYHL